MRKFIVDRIEGDKAVLECENGTFVEMEVASLPKNLKEGDVIRFKANSCFLNADETERRRQKIQRLMEQVFEDEQ
ncbi:MAG: DUF3006 domain-containing protein [Ruminococcus sp.]